jgi:hypothetical protein
MLTHGVRVNKGRCQTRQVKGAFLEESAVHVILFLEQRL